MKRDLIYQHFQKSGFDDMQSDALAAILDEMATKQDLALLRSELSSLRAEMNAGHASLRNEMTASLSASRNEMTAALNGIRTEMQTMKGDLTWRFIALVVFLSTIVSLVTLFAR